MTNFAYAAIGEMLIGLGNQLKDPGSDLRKRFRLSPEQLMTLLGVIRIAASPDMQKRYIFDLAKRWNRSERTIRSWIEIGMVREGHKMAHDSRMYWYADEIDEDERNLIAYGYLKPKKHHRLRYFCDLINGMLH